MTIDSHTPAWRQAALCAQTDPDAFFPKEGGRVDDAKRICNRCEVKPECLQYALDHKIGIGVWGGLSAPERRKLKRNLKLVSS